MTKTVIETALTEELSDHLGYDKHDPVAGAGGRATCTVSPTRGFGLRRGGVECQEEGADSERTGGDGGQQDEQW